MSNENALQKLASTSHSMVEYAFQKPDERQFAFRIGCAGLCQFHPRDWLNSVRLLRRATSDELNDEIRLKNLYEISKKISQLLSVDSDYVHEVYELVQSMRFSQDIETTMGSSILMQFRSNLRQDHESVLRQLVKAFPAFLEHSPKLAVLCINHAILQGHPYNSYKAVTSITYRQKTIPFKHDNSCVWDVGSVSRHEHHHQLLKCFTERLVLRERITAAWLRTLA